VVSRLFAFENGRAVPLVEAKFLDEATLQRRLEENPELLAFDELETGALPLVPIGREVPLGGQSLDLLYIDASGRLTAVEAKLRKNSEIRRQVAGQVLEYGAYLSNWTVEDVERQASRYLGDPRTPLPLRSNSLWEAIRRASPEPDVPDFDEAEMQDRIAKALAQRDFRLVIAVDKIVDSLRAIVSFVDSSSSFGLYLLEIQEQRANSLQLAAISLYSGKLTDSRHSTSIERGRWDEARFLEVLDSQAKAASIPISKQLFSFIVERSDVIAWGTGRTEGSAGFGVRGQANKLTIFGITTRGKLWIPFGGLNRRLSLSSRETFLGVLQGLGLNAPESLLQAKDAWLQSDVDVLASGDRLERFKSAVLVLAEERTNSG
jgi:hypothetical protein